MQNKILNDSFVNIKGTAYYKISDYADMKPFLFTLATSGDLWIHLSTYGGITAGRCSSDTAIFPYVPEDVLHHSADTGSKTLVKVKLEGKTYLWQPFDASLMQPYETERNLYKSVLGNTVIFEEINHSLDMVFKYQWRTSNKYGLVRTSTLTSIGTASKAEVLDGVINILPYGVSEALQKASSCMVDGYKRAEFTDNKGTAVYALTSAFSDMPEALEILKATLFWNNADFDNTVYFYENALDDFARDRTLEYNRECIGERCCYLISFIADLNAEKEKEWSIIGDIGVNHSRIAEISHCTNSIPLEEDIKASSIALCKIAAMTDGLQLTADKTSYAHHLSCVIYNDMRGGTFINGYDLNFADFISFIKAKNIFIYNENIAFLNTLKGIAAIPELKQVLAGFDCSDLYRLCLEYIPVSFSRRHGDPSRPWNKFSIILSDNNGDPITYYEGNWRDVFQNWEALCMSFPDFYENTIVKFLNNSTADGFNPLKINKYGFEWETPDSVDEWASFGYSGDHQIIYLIRLIDRLRQFNPNGLNTLFENDIFTYADTPYELAEFNDMLENPKWTIRFNAERNKRITENALKYGEDYKFIMNRDRPYCVSFAEKLTVQAMSKMSNLVAGGGIWMNTQKAEWNDANNALAGYGLSVVTACQLRRYIVELLDIFKAYKDGAIMMTIETADWLNSIIAVLEKHLSIIKTDSVDDTARYAILSELGYCFDGYKRKIYTNGFTGKTQCRISRIIGFFRLALQYIEYTVNKNRRNDGMYHSYNIMLFSEHSIAVHPLSLMLEGQVAALDCGILSSAESAGLLSAMERSELFSERDKSFYLYPPRLTKRFMERNIIPDSYKKKSSLLTALIKDGNIELVIKDRCGTIRFNDHICDVKALKSAINTLSNNAAYSELVKQDYSLILECFDEVFGHSKFIGRSQIMYKYEGIGCIYWHQNSKLRVAVMETLLRAVKSGDSKAVSSLKKHYISICSGLCYNKTAEEWGAFPTDSYSHTPYIGGASQPVMTGQVKEDIIARYSELGIVVEDGCIVYKPELIDETELLSSEAEFEYIAVDTSRHSIRLPIGSYALTFCAVPVICISGEKNAVTLYQSSKNPVTINSLCIPRELSHEIFMRSGNIRKICIEYSGI